jgi:hypothetical protein
VARPSILLRLDAAVDATAWRRTEYDMMVETKTTPTGVVLATYEAVTYG